MKEKIQPVSTNKYIDLITDFGFKRLLGSEPNKELLMNFLNALFEGRKCIVDLTCTGLDGEQFIIEVQRATQHYFKDRAVYYTSTLIHEQGAKGYKDWNYCLKEVYLIGLMEFCFPDTEPGIYLHRASILNEKTGKLFYEKLGYTFIELPKFIKQENELETDLDRWLFLLKNMSKLQMIPAFLRKPIFEKVFAIAEIINLSKEEYMRYAKSQMAKWDEYAIRKTAEDNAREKGMKEGIEKTKIEMVKALLTTAKLTVSELAAVAKVSETTVLKIKKSLN